LALFWFVHFMLTRPVARLAQTLFSARDGAVIAGQREFIHELQMLDDAAVALAAAHHELRTAQHLANTDALTGLANRRMFEQEGQRAISHARRYGEVLVAVVFDIDHFKRINDEYGHESGDAVLRALGTFLRDAVRAAEYPVARIGGEEFALLLTHTPEEQAMLLAERLRRGIEEIEVVMPKGNSVHFTVSMGVAECNASDNSLSALMRRADIALYQAKNNGRNRVERANEGTRPLPFL
jgi:diguanylate cyclase (GGDEF)-like protein